jgi:NAD(P)-dependent dehydrogenase (short-subunit alcohol dehydrogenase family)
MACRNEKTSREARVGILDALSNDKDAASRLEFMKLDLGSLASVKSFVEAYTVRGVPLHALIMNAGLNMDRRVETVDGLEMVTGVNWIAHFYLSNLLRPLLDASAEPGNPARVVHVSSQAHAFVGVPQFGPKKGGAKGKKQPMATRKCNRATCPFHACTR